MEYSFKILYNPAAMFLETDTERFSTYFRSLHIEKQSGYPNLISLQQRGASSAFSTLQEATREKLIFPLNIKNIMDFGAGSGGSAFALTSLAHLTNSRVLATEIDPGEASFITKHNILPESCLYIGDGTVILRTLGMKFDLITGFMFGPLYEDTLFPNFLEASKTSLTNDGNILITSNGGTLYELMKQLNTLGIRYSMLYRAIVIHQEDLV